MLYFLLLTERVAVSTVTVTRTTDSGSGRDYSDSGRNY